ncbi:hypothetical protein F4679DRAFT_537206 [Xylaria curta]|nr:hypothetical protein F4679DRAFT_537206 [Xylaria curta]
MVASRNTNLSFLLYLLYLGVSLSEFYNPCLYSTSFDFNMPISPGDRPFRQVGSGTRRDPLIMWLVQPPRSVPRMLGNEAVARSLGRGGFTHIWIRSCDHSTTRTSVMTRRGHRYRQMVRTDSHITLFCGRSSTADSQGHVYLVVEDGVWRVMQDDERRDRNGTGIELYDFP